MSSQSKSSVDLDIGSPCNNPEVKANNARIHPPRLQHSPSLPNIWFPPHSGPIPPQFEEITREPLRRLSTPPCPDASNLAKSRTAKLSADEELNHHPDAFSFDQAQTRPLKISMRRRADREHNHTNSLLTPPLTPSSSLKTAPSSESAVQADVSSDCIRENSGNEADCKSTRFLLLGNISRQVRHETLRASIVEALTAPRVGVQNSPQNPSIPRCHTNGDVISEDSIKGIFLRCQQFDGIVLLAFFDVRHAETAKAVIATPSAGPLSQCIGDDLAEDGTKAWITCQFISGEELAEVIGSSPFLTSTNASFSLAVEDRALADPNDEKHLQANTDYSSEDDNVGSTLAVMDGDPAEINIGMLKRFLKSFGGLRFFSVEKDMEDKKKHQNETIFRIEYYDVRAATSAYAAVDKQTLFGMKLRVFGRADLADSLSANQRPQEYPCAQGATPNPCVAEENGIAIVASSAENQDGLPTQIGYPGQFSHTRERLFVDGQQPQTHHSIQGQEVLTNSGSPVPSPTYFYTSDPTADAPSSASLPSEDLSRSGSEDALYSTANVSEGRSWFCDTGAPFHSPPGLYPHHDCYYYPSQGGPTTNPPSNYYLPCSTPSPFYQQGPQTPPQNALFSAIHAYGYQYDNFYPQPLTQIASPNPANMFEHGMMTVSRPHAGDFWFPEPLVSPPGTQHPLYYGPQSPMTGSSSKSDHRTLPENPGDIYWSNLPPTIGSSSYQRPSHPTSLHRNPSGGKESRPSAEHNQLNLSKIEDGQDTRTTVMIKNIPNKMSDKDLVTFIGKVCPRRIDFLYLRMDFQNGCNVGYAFVNFITVQDLLIFAKKKLGQKWNMFSSEKVLQMSYANYQGKEALVEKFKNSCIMDEQESWRPKIFYSEAGPEQGLPEPFPAPTHIRRKERSAFNRGALYMPGIRSSMPPGPISQTRRLEDTRKINDRHVQSSTPGSYTLGGNSCQPLNTKSWGSSQ